jgi:methyl halide transferase
VKAFWENYWNTHDLKEMPWFIGRPDHNLVTWMLANGSAHMHVLDLGCGNGDNAVWLAQQGMRVTACDISKTAVDCARHRANAAGVKIEFAEIDVLNDALPGRDFDVIFDRGLLHQFNYAEDRAKVPLAVKNALKPNGIWLSVIGSTELCQHRALTPPRRSALDIVQAVEPHLRIERLQASTEEMVTEQGLEYCSAWLMVARKRTVDARPWVPRSGSVKPT